VCKCTSRKVVCRGRVKEVQVQRSVKQWKIPQEWMAGMGGENGEALWEGSRRGGPMGRGRKGPSLWCACTARVAML